MDVSASHLIVYLNCDHQGNMLELPVRLSVCLSVVLRPTREKKSKKLSVFNNQCILFFPITVQK